MAELTQAPQQAVLREGCCSIVRRNILATFFGLRSRQRAPDLVGMFKAVRLSGYGGDSNVVVFQGSVPTSVQLKTVIPMFEEAIPEEGPEM